MGGIPNCRPTMYVVFSLSLAFAMIACAVSPTRSEMTNSLSAFASLQNQCALKASKIALNKKRLAYIKRCMAVVENKPAEPGFVEPQ